jgi:dienelactone hydrolase
MKKIFYILFFLSSTFYASGQQMVEFDQLTRQFIDHLGNNHLYEAEDMLNEELTNLMSLDQLEDLWKRLLVQQGSYEIVDEVVFQDMGGTVISSARTFFSISPAIIQLSFDEDKKISGIFLKSDISDERYVLPAYANRDLYFEEEVFLEVPQGQLPATFTRPVFVDKYPVVIFIHGSGPHDRDQTIGPNKPFRDLAIGLATQGVASFRFDKKTKVYPGYFNQIQSHMTIEDEVLEDAASAIDAVRKLDGVNRRQIYILGHGLGGMLAPRIAKENRQVDGIIIMGGNANPLEEIIDQQIEYLLSHGRITDDELHDLQLMREQMLRINALKNIGVSAHDLYLDMPDLYWNDLMNYDQIAVAQDLKEPILILQGGRDYQVPVQEFELWKRALADKENAFFLIYPSLNHIFLPGEGLSFPWEYSLAGHIPIEVVMDIARWIKLDK